MNTISNNDTLMIAIADYRFFCSLVKGSRFTCSADAANYIDMLTKHIDPIKAALSLDCSDLGMVAIAKGIIESSQKKIAKIEKKYPATTA